MPFDLTEYDREFASFITDTVDAVARARSPLLSQIAVEKTTGTASSVVARRGEERLDLLSQPVGFHLGLDSAAIQDGAYESLVVEVSTAADELAKQLVGMLITTVQQITESTGNVFEVGGKLTFEHLYRALDRIEWSLTETGELSMPSLVMHPDKVKDLPQLTPAQDASIEELKRRKYEELLARRRSRRLS